MVNILKRTGLCIIRLIYHSSIRQYWNIHKEYAFRNTDKYFRKHDVLFWWYVCAGEGHGKPQFIVSDIALWKHRGECQSFWLQDEDFNTVRFRNPSRHCNILFIIVILDKRHIGRKYVEIYECWKRPYGGVFAIVRTDKRHFISVQTKFDSNLWFNRKTIDSSVGPFCRFNPVLPWPRSGSDVRLGFFSTKLLVSA